MVLRLYPQRKDDLKPPETVTAVLRQHNNGKLEKEPPTTKDEPSAAAMDRCSPPMAKQPQLDLNEQGS